MGNRITEDDLNLSADTSDRLGESSYSHQEYAAPVRGTDGVKAIFNPANRKRLVVYAACGLILLIALLWVFFSFEEQDIAQGGSGRIQGAGVNTRTNDNPSYIQREEAEYFNNVVLPKQQETEPTAHPVILTEPDDINPFKSKSEPKRAGRISEIGQQANQTQVSAGTAPPPVDYREIDSLIKDLIAHEGSNIPQSYNVEWSYNPVTSATTNPVIMATSSVETENDGQRSCTVPVTRAASMYMATTDLALNSDVGGPVALTIRNGRLSGTQLLGSFERKEHFLRMELNTLVTAKETLPITAIALDMDTTLNAVEGELDRHLMYRYGWWGFGTTLKAIGKAAELNADSQVTVTNGAVVESTASNSSREIKLALGSLGEDIGSVFQDRVNRPVTVSLKVGDEVGVFFLDDVCLTSGRDSGY